MLATFHPENPVEEAIPVLAYEIDEDKKHAVIRQCDHAVCNDAQPHDSGLPHGAETMRHEFRRKQLLKRSHDAALHLTRIVSRKIVIDKKAIVLRKQ